jgi:putative endonuclease
MSDAWVYMLRCRDGSLYTGWSNDVQRRLERHLTGRASRYTASRLPVELVLSIAVHDRSAAMREEARIKRLDRSSKLALIEQHRLSGRGAASGGGVADDKQDRVLARRRPRGGGVGGEVAA